MTENEYILYMEIKGVYDGWSVGVLSDGTMVNRWGPDDGPRYEATQKFINLYDGKYDVSKWQPRVIPRG